jgi:DNA transformation protein
MELQMAASPGFADFLRDQLGPLGRIEMRRMFGKTGLFCEGVMLAMVRDDVLYFRVDEFNREALQEGSSLPPLDYVKGGKTIDLAFWRAPDRLLDKQDELLKWARSALEAAHRVAGKRPMRGGRQPKG